MIFVDVGAHDGQTLEEVLKPRWAFTKIWAFEPMPAQYANLARFEDDRLTIVNAGLSDRDADTFLYGTNEAMEASVHPAKRDVDAAVRTPCRLVSAGDFFARWIDGPAVLKLNCEGSECDILADLVRSGQIGQVAEVLIDFDVRKIPGLEHREAETLELLASIGFGRYSVADQVMHGTTHQRRIENWLSLAGF